MVILYTGDSFEIFPKPREHAGVLQKLETCVKGCVHALKKLNTEYSTPYALERLLGSQVEKITTVDSLIIGSQEQI